MTAGEGKNRKRLRTAIWFGLLTGLFAGAIAMYTAWLLNPEATIHSEATIHWGPWLRIGGVWTLLVGLLVTLVAWALSSFYLPKD